MQTCSIWVKFACVVTKRFSIATAHELAPASLHSTELVLRSVSPRAESGLYLPTYACIPPALHTYAAVSREYAISWHSLSTCDGTGAARVVT